MTAYCWFVRGERHAAMARVSIESVRKADPGSKCIVVADDDVNIAAPIHQMPGGMPIMLANLEAQFRAMLLYPDEDIVFLDTDTLVLEPIVPADATLTITWRDHVRTEDGAKVEGIASEMPYNYGVLIARKCSLAIDAIIWMRERIRKMHPRLQAWYGNQLALFELAGPRPESGIRIDKRRIPWTLTQYGNEIEIAKVPCETWNYTPSRVGEPLEGKKVLHFKGHARALMESYAKRLGLVWYQEAA